MHRLEHRRLSRMQVAARGHAEPSLQAGREVRDDVAKHVVGDDHIELRGSRTICMQSASTYMCSVLFRGYSRCHFFEHALPQAAGVAS